MSLSPQPLNAASKAEKRTSEEDKCLVDLSGQGCDWEEMSQIMYWRSPSDIAQRWNEISFVITVAQYQALPQHEQLPGLDDITLQQIAARLQDLEELPDLDPQSSTSAGSSTDSEKDVFKAEQDGRYLYQQADSPNYPMNMSGKAFAEPNRKRKWAEDDDKVMSRGVAIGQNFEDFAWELSGREVEACNSRSQCDTEGALTEIHPLEGDNMSRTEENSQYPSVQPADPTSSMDTPANRNWWRKEEDEVLLNGFAAGKKFREIALEIPGRETAACKTRWNLHLKKHHPEISCRRDSPSVDPWTKQEDKILLDGLAAGKQYKEVALEVPGRAAKACAARLLQLRSHVKFSY